MRTYVVTEGHEDKAEERQYLEEMRGIAIHGLARASAVLSSLRPAPAAGADAGEWGLGPVRSEAETAGPLECRGLRGANS